MKNLKKSILISFVPALACIAGTIAAAIHTNQPAATNSAPATTPAPAATIQVDELDLDGEWTLLDRDDRLFTEPLLDQNIQRYV